MTVFKKQNGFTLIELVVAVACFSLIAFGLIALVSNTLVMSGKQGGLLASSDMARKNTFWAMNELRAAAPSSTGAYSLEQAQPQQLIFYSNIDNDSLMERLRYFTQGGKLYKGILKPSDNPINYDVANEQVTMVQQDLANGSDPVFYYYDGFYKGLTDDFLTQPVNIIQVKHIKMLLKIYNKLGSGNTYFTATASGTIRNVKTNLGE